jgi:uncharacterized protein YndB with AHSA1/START domain
MQSDPIRWPPRYAPANAPVHVRNERVMRASPEAVWGSLIRAALWPEWYPNSSNVRFVRGSPPDLAAGTRFHWKTFGVAIDSTVVEFVPGERVAWNARGIGVDAYHAWLVRPIAGGCHVLTEETQHGWLARLGHLLFPRRMHRGHELWLESLEERARRGPTSTRAPRCFEN